MSETVMVRGADGAEFFYTLDRVLTGLLQTLAAGRVDEAVDLYSRVREDIAFQLISKASGNKEVFQQVANLFFRARDYQRAAYCCEQLDEQDKAAQLYEKAGDHAAAAQCFAAAGNTAKAAEMFEKGGNAVEAARLFLINGTPEAVVRAALCFEKAGRLFDAAQAWDKAGRAEKALALYAAVDDDSPDKKLANKLSKELIERSGAKPAATGTFKGSDIRSAIAGGAPADERDRVTLMEGFEFLQRLPLFAELSLVELKKIYHLCEVVSLAAGAPLVERGTSSPALWVLLEGGVVVRAQNREVAQLGPGAHVGEMGLFDEAAAGVDVVASSPVRALRLDKQGFKDVMVSDDAFAVRVYRVLFSTLRDRLRATTGRLAAGAI